MNFFRKEPTVKEQQRQNDRELRKAGRDLERDKLALEREEKKLEMEIKKMAKEGNNEGCKMLAKQLVQMRKQKTRLYTANSKGKGKPLSKDEVKALLHLIERSKIITNKTTNATTNKLKLDEWKRIATIFNATASICWRSPRQLRLKWENLKKNSRKRSMNIKTNQISSVQIHNKAMGANIAIAGAMGTTAKTMGSINKVLNPHQIAKDMEAFKQANLKMDMADDLISDTLDDIMTESGDEEESEGIVNQVLDEIGIEVSGKMANAPSVARNKVGESTSDIDKELMAQLTKLKS